MALSEIDRNLLDRCLARKPRAWEDFVDRFMGLVVHVINHTAGARSVRLGEQDLEDFCADVFLTIVKNDFAVLRRFRGQSSLATYLTVIARRVVVHDMLLRKSAARLTDPSAPRADGNLVAGGATVAGATVDGAEQRLDDRDEVEQLLDMLEGDEATIVRLYHLDGKTYQEISAATGMPENSVGPTLSRAREKMRRAAGAEPSAS